MPRRSTRATSWWLAVLDADAALEQMDRRSLAVVELRLVREAIARYREARAPGKALRGAKVTAVATLAFVVAIVLFTWLARRIASLRRHPGCPGSRRSGCRACMY